MKKVSEEEKTNLLQRLAELITKINKVNESSAGQKGMSTVEYAMMVMFIAAVAILGFELLGVSVKSLFEVANVLPK